MSCPGGQQSGGEQGNHDRFEVDGPQQLHNYYWARGHGDSQRPPLRIRCQRYARHDDDDTGERRDAQDDNRGQHAVTGQRVGSLQQTESQRAIRSSGRPPDRIARQQARMVTQDDRATAVGVEARAEHRCLRDVAVDVQAQDRRPRGGRYEPHGQDDHRTAQ